MVKDFLRRRAEWSARMDPVAVRRGPTSTDVMVRERAVLGLSSVVILAAIVFWGVGTIAEFVDIRPPLEAIGVPGMAALAALVACRDPLRRDRSLSRLILFATGLSFFASVVGVLAWPGPAPGSYWIVSLACVLVCWALYYRWRTR